MKPITDGVWELHDKVVMFGIHFPVRTSIVRLADGGLWVYSPVSADDETFRAVDELGPVRYLVTPNGYHHMSVPRWQERYPEAETWVVPAITKRVPDLAHQGVLTPGGEAPFDDEIFHVTLGGMPAVTEVVCVHRASRTCFCGDLLFNVHESDSWFTRVALGAVRAFGRPAQSRAWRIWAKDRPAVGRALHRLLEEDFDRLVPCHGETLETGGKDAVREQCAWLLDAA